MKNKAGTEFLFDFFQNEFEPEGNLSIPATSTGIKMLTITTVHV